MTTEYPSSGLVVAAIVTAGLFTFLYHICFPKKYLQDLHGKRLDGPPAKLVGGNISVLWSCAKDDYISKGLSDEMHRRHVNLMALQVPFAPKYLICVGSASGMKAVLAANYNAFPKGKRYMTAMGDFIGEGLVTANGNTWKLHRSLVNPAFHASHIDGLSSFFAKHALLQQQLWMERMDNAQTNTLILDLHHEMMLVTADIITDVGFGYQLNAKLNEQSVAQVSIEHVLEEMAQRIKQPPFFYYFRHIPTARNRKWKTAIAHLKGLVQQIIAQRKTAYAENKAVAKTKRDADLLDLMMGAVADDELTKLDDKELLDECLTFLGAGHETTSNMLTWTLYELARHPDVQESLHKQIHSVLGDRPVNSFADVKPIEYLHMVLKEAMRMYPPISSVVRDAACEFTIDEFRFPRGTRVLLNFNALHHNPDVWDEPDQFRPVRFKPEAERQRDFYAYLPFSMGPRNCIGQRFAMQEGAVILATIIQHFRVEPASSRPAKPVQRITTRPEGGMSLRLVRR